MCKTEVTITKCEAYKHELDTSKPKILRCLNRRCKFLSTEDRRYLGGEDIVEKLLDTTAQDRFGDEIQWCHECREHDLRTKAAGLTQRLDWYIANAHKTFGRDLLQLERADRMIKMALNVVDEVYQRTVDKQPLRQDERMIDKRQHVPKFFHYLVNREQRELEYTKFVARPNPALRASLDAVP